MMISDDDARGMGRALWVLWTVFVSVAVGYGGLAMGATGTGVSDLRISLPRANDSLEVAISLFAIANLVQFVFLSRGMARSLRRRLQDGQGGKIVSLNSLAPWIIRWVVLDGVPVWGMLLAFLRHDIGKFVPFLAITILGFLFSIPSEKRLKTLLQTSGIGSVGSQGQ